MVAMYSRGNCTVHYKMYTPYVHYFVKFGYVALMRANKPETVGLVYELTINSSAQDYSNSLAYVYMSEIQTYNISGW